MRCPGGGRHGLEHLEGEEGAYAEERFLLSRYLKHRFAPFTSHTLVSRNFTAQSSVNTSPCRETCACPKVKAYFLHLFQDTRQIARASYHLYKEVHHTWESQSHLPRSDARRQCPRPPHSREDTQLSQPFFKITPAERNRIHSVTSSQQR